jgi:hypothetical protein
MSLLRQAGIHQIAEAEYRSETEERERANQVSDTGERKRRKGEIDVEDSNNNDVKGCDFCNRVSVLGRRTPVPPSYPRLSPGFRENGARGKVSLGSNVIARIPLTAPIQESTKRSFERPRHVRHVARYFLRKNSIASRLLRVMRSRVATPAHAHPVHLLADMRAE